MTPKVYLHHTETNIMQNKIYKNLLFQTIYFQLHLYPNVCFDVNNMSGKVVASPFELSIFDTMRNIKMTNANLNILTYPKYKDMASYLMQNTNLYVHNYDNSLLCLQVSEDTIFKFGYDEFGLILELDMVTDWHNFTSITDNTTFLKLSTDEQINLIDLAFTIVNIKLVKTILQICK